MIQKEKLTRDIEQLEMMLDRANRLISGLAGEKIRWEETVKVFFLVTCSKSIKIKQLQQKQKFEGFGNSNGISTG